MIARPYQRHALGRMPSGSLLFGGQRSRSHAHGYHTTMGPRGRTFGRGLGDVQTSWPASVEQWRPLVAKYAGGIPVEFLLAWISRESGGNPCSYTTLHEAGIWQLMPPDNTARAGTTEAALRAYCVGSTQQAARPLTQDELEEQVRSGIQYINYARKLAHSVVPWSESDPDFWKMVKMVHVAPARVTAYGPGSSSWADFVSRVQNTPVNWTNNADWVGSYGVGGGGIGATISDAVAGVRGLGAMGWLAIGGIAVAGALVYRQRKHGGPLLSV